MTSQSSNDLDRSSFSRQCGVRRWAVTRIDACVPALEVFSFLFHTQLQWHCLELINID